MKIFKLVFSPIEVNTYVLVDESGVGAIIDCGCYDKHESEKLEAFSGKKIDAKFSVDPSIKGGFVANIDDTIIDASIKRQLELLYDNFRKGSFSTN